MSLASSGQFWRQSRFTRSRQAIHGNLERGPLRKVNQPAVLHRMRPAPSQAAVSVGGVSILKELANSMIAVSNTPQPTQANSHETRQSEWICLRAANSRQSAKHPNQLTNRSNRPDIWRIITTRSRRRFLARDHH